MTGEKYMLEERRQDLTETDVGSYDNPKEWLEKFIGDEGVVYNDSKSDANDNGGENFNENNQ